MNDNNTTQNNETKTTGPLWTKTEDGLRQNTRSGVWFLNLKINNRVISETTGQTSKTIAKEIKARRVAQIKAHAAVAAPVTGEKITFATLALKYSGRLDTANLSPKTITKRKHILATIKKSWATFHGDSFDKLDPKHVNYDTLLAWRDHFVKVQKYSPDYTNKTVSVLVELYELAIEGNPTVINHAKRLGWLTVPPTVLVLPSEEKFAEALAALDTGYRNQKTTHCRDLIEGLSLVGLRLEEAQLLTRDEVDLASCWIHLQPSQVKGRKHGRSVPIIPQAVALFTRLVAEADPATGAIFHVKKCYSSLRRACRKAGIANLTHHKLRHFFATRCLENGASLPVVAKFLGHQDGGALAGRTYIHVRDEHSEQVRLGLKFGGEKPENVVPLKAQVA